MNQITFEKLKQNCVREFCSKNTRGYHGELSGGSNAGTLGIAQLIEFKRTGKPTAWRKMLAEAEDDCVRAIESVDIRCVKALAELCPESVPEWIKKGNYTVDLTDDGWMFFRN
jgi:hypothetical protein